MLLNPELYGILQAKFGSVLVAKEGEPFLWRLENRPDGSRKLQILNYGENYRICCPYCWQRGDPDRRHRLWVSHAFGTYVGNELVGLVPIWYAASCFHNNCLDDPITISQFRMAVFGPNPEPRPPILYDQVLPDSAASCRLYPELPGRCVPIHAVHSEHPAIKFLALRGLDPTTAYENYRLHVCAQCEQFPYIVDGIVIPIIENKQQVGWQCRLITADKRMRYFTPPGFQIRRYLYNIDSCFGDDYVVVVEGPFDAMRLGKAVALFGKTASLQQEEALSRWPRCVIFLDPDAQKEAEALRNRLSARGVKASIVRGHCADPAKLDLSESRQLISKSLEESGV